MLTAPLSRFQKTILRVAFQHRQAFGVPTPDLGHKAKTLLDVSSQELLGACYGAPTDSLRRRVEEPGFPLQGHLLRSEDLPDGARPALSRSLTRLQQRGLITVYSGVNSKWTGIVLTDEGLHMAAALPDVPGWPLPLKGPRAEAEIAADRTASDAYHASILDDVLDIVTRSPGLSLSMVRTRIGLHFNDSSEGNRALRWLLANHRVTKVKTRDGIRYYPGNISPEDVPSEGDNDT